MSAIAAVEERLAELRGGERGEARTQLLDLVVLADDPREAERMARLLEQLPGNRPSRAIIALAAHGQRELDATRRGRDDALAERRRRAALRAREPRRRRRGRGAAEPDREPAAARPARVPAAAPRSRALGAARQGLLVVRDARRRRLDRRALGPPLAAGAARARAQAQRHRSLLVEAHRLARARGPPLRPAARDARAGAPRPHRGDARRPLAGAGAAAGGLDPEPDAAGTRASS